VLSGQVDNLKFLFFFDLIEKVIAPVGNLGFDVFNFLFLHKLQKRFQMLYIKKCYYVVAKSAHLCVSQEPLLVFKSLIVGRVFLHNRNLLQPLVLLLTL